MACLYLSFPPGNLDIVVSAQGVEYEYTVRSLIRPPQGAPRGALCNHKYHYLEFGRTLDTCQWTLY